MSMSSNPYDITFFYVVKNTMFKFVYLGLSGLIAIGVITTAIVVAYSPTDLNGTTNEAMLDFEIKESSILPVKFVLSHDFPLTISGSTLSVSEGPEGIDYNLTITNSAGKGVLEKNGTFHVPIFIRIKPDATSYIDVYSEDLSLPVGKYTIALTATHPIAYELIQENGLIGPMIFSGFISAIGILLMVALVLATIRRREALRGARSMADHPTPAAAMRYPIGGPQYYSINPYPQPQPTPPPPIVDDRNTVEYICAICGNIIQNPAVQNVITCEKCGEKEYVG